MKKTLILILTLILMAGIVLASCDTSSSGGSGASTTATVGMTEQTTEEGTTAEQATTEVTTEESTTVPTEATTQAPDQPTEPAVLVGEFYEKNAALSRLVKNPVVTEIGDTGVDVELAYQAWPTICQGDGDTLYATSSLRLRHIDPFSATAFYVSHDNGETWSEPTIINNTPVDDRDTGIVYLGEGRMLVSFFTIGWKSFMPGGNYETHWGNVTEEQKAAKIAEWETYTAEELAKFNGSFVLLSNDYGKTWSEPIKVPVSCPHGPSLLNDGKTLIFPGIVSGKMMTYISKDYGATWEFNSSLELPELPDRWWGYWEPYVIQLKDGSFLAGIRTGTTGGEDADGNAYIGNKTLGVLTSTSKDGKNWEPATRIEGLHGSPPHFLELDNGVILLTYSYRWLESEGGRGPIGIRARLSYDGGKTWTTKDIRLSEHVSAKNNDLGYPSTVQLSDGTLITIYYQPWEEDTDCSVLYTKWRLVESEK